MLSQRSSMVIDAMRFPLIVLVVFIHILPGYYTPIPSVFNGYSIYVFLSEMVSHTFGRIAVPTFFIFSGYFLFYKLNESFETRKILQIIHKKLKTILVPYISWNIIFITTILIKDKIFSLVGSTKSDDFMCIVRTNNLYELFWSNTINYPLWYLRDLFCMILLSPIFYFLYTIINGKILVFILYFFYLFNFETQIPGFSSTAIFYFVVGSFLGYKKIDFVCFSQSIYKYLLPLTIILAPVVTLLNSTSYYEYLIRLFIPITIVVFGGSFCLIRIRFIEIFRKHSKSVLFIYAVHVIYITNWTKGWFTSHFSTTSLQLLIGYFIQPVIIILICLGFYKFCKKYMPKTLSFMTGGRT